MSKIGFGFGLALAAAVVCSSTANAQECCGGTSVVYQHTPIVTSSYVSTYVSAPVVWESNVVYRRPFYYTGYRLPRYYRPARIYTYSTPIVYSVPVVNSAPATRTCWVDCCGCMQCEWITSEPAEMQVMTQPSDTTWTSTTVAAPAAEIMQSPVTEHQAARPTYDPPTEQGGKDIPQDDSGTDDLR